MPKKTDEPAELRDPPVRFGMRGVLIVMTVLAIVVACFAPSLRGWEADRWRALVDALVWLAPGVLFGIALQIWTIRRQRRRAGNELVWLLRSESRQAIRRGSMHWLMSPFTVATSQSVTAVPILAVSSMRIDQLQSKADQLRGNSFIAGFLTAQLCVPFWFAFQKRWVRGVVLGQGGVWVAADLKFYAWTIITVLGRPEQSEANELSLRISGSYPKTITLEVAPDRAELVAELIEQKLPPRQR